MTQISPRDFCQWFKGVLDITNGEISPTAVLLIKQKLDAVFTHEPEPEKAAPSNTEDRPPVPRC